MEKREKRTMQWHPAFYAGIRIELEEEADKLLFENEHQLGTKPKEIDVLIIKKNVNEQIRKNIGRIFRKHNLVEYKSPVDYLSIDDFYKVYGYACFYKSDVLRVDEIKADDMTISFVSHHYPRKFMKHLVDVRNFVVTEQEAGIYYIEGDIFLMQLIVTSELSEENNLWLHNLTNDLKENETARKLIREYGKHRDEKLYESVMDIIMRANKERFEEVNKMCKALEELMEDRIVERENIAKQRGIEVGIEKGIEKLILDCLKRNDSKSVAEFLGIPLENVLEIAKANL